MITTLPIFCPVSTYRYAVDDLGQRVAAVDDRPELPGSMRSLRSFDHRLVVPREAEQDRPARQPAA